MLQSRLHLGDRTTFAQSIHIAVSHVTASFTRRGLARAPGAGTNARAPGAGTAPGDKGEDKRSARHHPLWSFSRITYSTVGILINLGTMGSSIFFFTALRIFPELASMRFFSSGELETSTQQCRSAASFCASLLRCVLPQLVQWIEAVAGLKFGL